MNLNKFTVTILLGYLFVVIGVFISWNMKIHREHREYKIEQKRIKAAGEQGEYERKVLMHYGKILYERDRVRAGLH